MQTAYFTTRHFIRHTGNLVDLAEYRRRMERANPPGPGQTSRPEAGTVPVPAGRPDRRTAAGLCLDYCASAAVVVMAVVATVQFLVL